MQKYGSFARISIPRAISRWNNTETTHVEEHGGGGGSRGAAKVTRGRSSGAFRGIIFQPANVNYGYCRLLNRSIGRWKPRRSSPEIFRSLSKGRRHNTAPLRAPSLEWRGAGPCERGAARETGLHARSVTSYAERVSACAHLFSHTHTRTRKNRRLAAEKIILASKIFRYRSVKRSEEERLGVVTGTELTLSANGRFAQRLSGLPSRSIPYGIKFEGFFFYFRSEKFFGKVVLLRRGSRLPPPPARAMILHDSSVCRLDGFV